MVVREIFLTSKLIISNLDSLLVPIKEGDSRVYRSTKHERLYYVLLKFDQEVSAYVKMLTEWSLTRSLKKKNKREEQSVIHKSDHGDLRERSLVRAVNYKKRRGEVK